jgi:transposase
MASGWQDFDVLYFEKLTIIVEPTGTYSDPLVDRARKAELNVVRINGHKTNKAKELFDSSPTMHARGSSP